MWKVHACVSKRGVCEPQSVEWGTKLSFSTLFRITRFIYKVFIHNLFSPVLKTLILSIYSLILNVDVCILNVAFLWWRLVPKPWPVLKSGHTEAKVHIPKDSERLWKLRKPVLQKPLMSYNCFDDHHQGEGLPPRGAWPFGQVAILSARFLAPPLLPFYNMSQ